MRERNASEEEPLKVSLKGVRGMGKVPGEGEKGGGKTKNVKQKDERQQVKDRELNQKTKKEKEGKCLKDGTVGKS